MWRVQDDIYDTQGDGLCGSNLLKQELPEANHRARRSAGEKLNISPLDIGHE